jgi:prepilin-type N-terminal cleavage/methylation domain-containing protein
MRKSKGFTLIEILISISVIGVLAVVSVPNYLSFRNHRILKSELDKLNFILIEVQENARTQKDENEWGVRFINNTGLGNDYYESWEGSTSTVVNKISLNKSIGFQSLSSTDIKFAKLTGLPVPSQTYEFKITSFDGKYIGTISVSTSGVIDSEITRQ